MMCSRQSGIFLGGLENAEPDLSGRSLCVDEENWGQTEASFFFIFHRNKYFFRLGGIEI